MDGFILVDKPQGLSSFDVIRQARKALSIKKIGHSGTLDPCATGLLLLAIGKATRLLPYLPSEPKMYQFSILFGKTTDTLDSEGALIDEGKPIPSEKKLVDALKPFLGSIEQEPPQYSAIKINGTRAYALARKNKPVEMPKRMITIHKMTLLSYNNDEASLETVCSKGVYVRSLARDIALQAGSVGFASSIRRTAIAKHTVEKAITLDILQRDAKSHIISIYEMFSGFPSFTANPQQVDAVQYGKEFDVDETVDSPTVLMFSPERVLMAVANKKGPGRYHPEKVFV